MKTQFTEMIAQVSTNELTTSTVGTTQPATSAVAANANASANDVASVALFYLLATIVIASAVGVIFTRDIVRTAVCLLFALLGVGGFYFLLGAEFLAAVQLVVYVGGTLMLIVFGVMLTSRSPHTRFEPKRKEVVVAIIAGVLSLVSLIAAIIRTPLKQDISPQPMGQVREIGVAMLSEFLMPFELASVILLVVMIGAAYLARPRKEREL